jgi:hypothetical protein
MCLVSYVGVPAGHFWQSVPSLSAAVTGDVLAFPSANVEGGYVGIVMAPPAPATPVRQSYVRRPAFNQARRGRRARTAPPRARRGAWRWLTHGLHLTTPTHGA